MIEPIELLVGSHTDTGTTGHGCFMNVVAYLNGDSQITDKSDCVCFVMRPLVIYANDLFNDNDRQKLLPFIMRAVDSRTDDGVEITRRLALIIEFAKKQNKSICDSANYINNFVPTKQYTRGVLIKKNDYSFTKYSKDLSMSNARTIAVDTVICAENAARYANCADAFHYSKLRNEYKNLMDKSKSEIVPSYEKNYLDWYTTTREDLLTLFDNCFPQITEPQQAHIERAKQLIKG